MLVNTAMYWDMPVIADSGYLWLIYLYNVSELNCDSVFDDSLVLKSDDKNFNTFIIWHHDGGLLTCHAIECYH